MQAQSGKTLHLFKLSGARILNEQVSVKERIDHGLWATTLQCYGKEPPVLRWVLGSL